MFVHFPDGLAVDLLPNRLILRKHVLEMDHFVEIVRQPILVAGQLAKLSIDR